MTRTSDSSDYDNVILADCPVAFWSLGTDETGVTDQTGHGHNGRAYGRPEITTFVNGDPAIAFDGVAQYIEVPDHAALSVPATGILTIEAWLRPDVLEFPRQEGTNYVHWMGKGDVNQYEYVCAVSGVTSSPWPLTRTSL